MNHYRNKRTGEFRDVEADSAEQFSMQREVGPDGRPVWEQTGFHHAQAVKVRAAHGELEEPDLGEEHKDALTSPALVPDAGPEFAPHLALTPGEIESGQTPEQKTKDLAAMFATDETSNRHEVLETAADTIADERIEKAQQQAGRLRSRAGGSEDYDENPRGDGGTSDEGGSRSKRGSKKAAEETPSAENTEAGAGAPTGA